MEAIHPSWGKDMKRSRFAIASGELQCCRKVEVPEEAGDCYFSRYPDESIAAWHERLGLVKFLN
jgi:hypothetical protein